MVRNYVDDNLHVQFVSTHKKCLRICQITVTRIDISRIGYVVASVFIRRFIERTHPYCINPEVMDVTEVCGDAVQITFAISVTIEKGTWINLVEDGIAPPVRLTHLTRQMPDIAPLECILII